MTIAVARAKWLVEYHAVTGKYMLKSKGKNYRASAAAYMLFLSVLLPQYSRRYKLWEVYQQRLIGILLVYSCTCAPVGNRNPRCQPRPCFGRWLVVEGQGHHCQPRPCSLASLPAYCARSISNKGRACTITGCLYITRFRVGAPASIILNRVSTYSRR